MSDWQPAGTNAIDYAPQVTTREQVREQFEKTQGVFLTTIAENDWGLSPETMTAALDHEEPVSLYLHSLPAVARFIGTELDTITAGNRGIGRMGKFPPRLGGKFRPKLQNPEAQIAIGAHIESILVAGFAGAVGVYSGLSSGAPQIVELDTDEIWQRWIPQAIYGLRSAGDAAGALTEPEREAFKDEAKTLGLVGSLSPKKKTTIEMISFFYASSGAALYEYQTDLPDR